jgi:hypothetical protein
MQRGRGGVDMANTIKTQLCKECQKEYHSFRKRLYCSVECRKRHGEQESARPTNLALDKIKSAYERRLMVVTREIMGCRTRQRYAAEDYYNTLARRIFGLEEKEQALKNLLTNLVVIDKYVKSEVTWKMRSKTRNAMTARLLKTFEEERTSLKA